ncbi:MAG: hypothetical protein CMJ28_04600 [Phycisphaerae bacterium]|nr:hypothetical protein [Phycisphaerae bacterium]
MPRTLLIPLSLMFCACSTEESKSYEPVVSSSPTRTVVADVKRAAIYQAPSPPSPDPWRASAEGDLVLLKMAINERSFDVNLADPLFKTTPLGHAAWWGRPGSVELLLASSATPDLAYGEPWTTPLHVACLWGHVEVAAALLNAGASPELPDEGGSTARENLRISEQDTMGLASAFQAPFAFESIQAGRDAIRKLIP